MQNCNYSSITLKKLSIYFPSITELIVIKRFSKISISFSIILIVSIGKARVSIDALLRYTASYCQKPAYFWFTQAPHKKWTMDLT